MNRPGIFTTGGVERARRTLGLAIGFELSLAVLAGLVGWVVGVSPWSRLCPRPVLPYLGWSVAWGLLAAVPLAAGLLLVQRCRIAPLRRIRRIVTRSLLPLFTDSPKRHLLAISLAAGLGEEALFRGLIQGGLAAHIGNETGQVLGILVASLLFGLAHCVTWTYALLAFLVGGYLGCLYVWSGSLLAPIVTHAAYDYYALVYLLRRWPGKERIAEKVKRPGRIDQAALMSPDQLISSEQSENSEFD